MLRDNTGTMMGTAAIFRDVSIRFEELRTLRRRLAELQNQFGTSRAMMPALELGKTPSDFTLPGGPVPHPEITPFQGAR